MRRTNDHDRGCTLSLDCVALRVLGRPAFKSGGGVAGKIAKDHQLLLKCCRILLPLGCITNRLEVQGVNSNDRIHRIRRVASILVAFAQQVCNVEKRRAVL